MVSDNGVNWTISHLCFESLISYHLFVLDVCSAQVVITIMADDITCENGEVDAGSIHELIHGREC